VTGVQTCALPISARLCLLISFAASFSLRFLRFPITVLRRLNKRDINPLFDLVGISI
jgi:hypothetical protein